MSLISDRSLSDYHYRGETPLKTIWLLFGPDQRHIFIAVGAFLIKHIPVWILPLPCATWKRACARPWRA